MDCRQSRIVAWSGLKCRATDVVTSRGNIGAFRQWATFSANRDGYYVHLPVGRREHFFSYIPAETTTAEFLKWMFEHGTAVSQILCRKPATWMPITSPSAACRRAASCAGLPPFGQFSAAGTLRSPAAYCAHRWARPVVAADITKLIDNVRLQAGD